MFQLQLFFLLHCDEWDRVVALPRHKFVTGDTLLQLTIGLRFSLYQKLSKLRKKKILRRFFANFCHEIGCENDQTYIFRFVRYLFTFFYSYLPVNIHFQVIIITIVSGIMIICLSGRACQSADCCFSELPL